MRSLSIAAVALTAIAAPASAAAPVTGKWITAERDSIIEIGQCGATLCGRVARVLAPAADGKPAIDSKNPDPKLRGRPVLGLTLLNDFMDSGKSWKGKIYDPKSGKTYKSILSRNPDGSLKVQGCVAFLCQAFTWTQAR